MFKIGDIVTFKPEFSDDPENEYKYVAITEVEKGRLDIKAIDSNLCLTPVEIVKPEWIKHI